MRQGRGRCSKGVSTFYWGPPLQLRFGPQHIGSYVVDHVDDGICRGVQHTHTRVSLVLMQESHTSPQASCCFTSPSHSSPDLYLSPGSGVGVFVKVVGVRGF